MLPIFDQSGQNSYKKLVKSLGPRPTVAATCWKNRCNQPQLSINDGIDIQGVCNLHPIKNCPPGSNCKVKSKFRKKTS